MRYIGGGNKDKIAHAWAHQHYDKCENYNGSMYYIKEGIFSYGPHYEIARLIPEYKKEKLVFLNSVSSSNTTNSHKRAVRSAIPKYWMKLEFTEGIALSSFKTLKNTKIRPLKEVRAHLELATSFAKKESKARKYSYVVDIAHHIEQARNFTEVFKLKSKLTKIEIAIIYSKEEQAKLFNFKGDFAEAKKLGLQKEKERRLKEDKKIIKEAKQDIIDWRNNLRNVLPRCVGDLIRLSVSKENIETSNQASIPIEDAKILWKWVKRIKEGDKNWTKKEGNFKVGRYEVDIIQAKTGDVVIGCHNILFTEMESLAKKLGW